MFDNRKKLLGVIFIFIVTFIYTFSLSRLKSEVTQPIKPAPTKVGVVKSYDFTYSDGTSSKINVYEPADYDPSHTKKWWIFLHSGGGDENMGINERYYRLEADKMDCLFVTLNGNGSNLGPSWIDLPEYNKPNKHLEEAYQFVKQKYNLDTYLPFLSGWSMGGYKTLYEMITHPHKYSAFACSSAVTSFIDWQNQADWPSHANWADRFGGPQPPTNNAVSDQAWKRHSIRQALSGSKRNLMSRKLKIAHGTRDTTLSYNEQFKLFIDEFPSKNLKEVKLVEDGIHNDFKVGDSDFFLEELRPVPPPLDSIQINGRDRANANQQIKLTATGRNKEGVTTFYPQWSVLKGQDVLLQDNYDGTAVIKSPISQTIVVRCTDTETNVYNDFTLLVGL